MKTKNLCMFAAFSALLTLGTQGAHGNTYSWIATTNATWSDNSYWNTAPTFNNEADLVFNNAMSSGYVSYLGGNKIIRSLDFGSGFSTSNNSFQVRTTTSISGGAAVLYLNGGTGNASITVDAGSPVTSISVGTQEGGTVVFQSAVDIYQNSTSALLYIDSTFNGSSSINKYGAGTFVLRRNGSAFSGNVNINVGTVLVYNDSRATGTGDFVLGQSDGADDATLQIGSFTNGNFTNDIVVNAGSGARTIKNYSGGNATLSGGTLNLSAGKDVTFDVTAYSASSNEINVGVAISGTGGVVKNGDGALKYWSANTYIGDTVINGGVLSVQGVGSINGGDVTINSGGQLAVVSQMIFNVGNSDNTEISGTGLLNYTGTMVLDLSGFTGSAGSWQLIDADSLDSGSSIALSGVVDKSGALTFSETTGVWTSSDGNWTFSEATGTLNLIPEPSAASLLVALLASGISFAARRRRAVA